ncbi:MAG: HEAT repeat domain-containing protein [Promethearchaeota archaeon]
MNYSNEIIQDHLAKLADPTVAYFHARRLSEIGREAIPLLCETLQKTARNPTEPSYGMTAWIIKALRDIGSEAVAPLLELLEDPNAQVRWAAASALSKIETEEHISALSDVLLKDPNPNVRWMAATALCPYIHKTRVLETYLQAVLDSSPFVRWLVISSLSQVPDPSFELFLAIANALKDSDEKIRNYALNALNEIPKPFSFLYQLSKEDEQLFRSLCMLFDEEYLIKKK